MATTFDSFLRRNDFNGQALLLLAVVLSFINPAIAQKQFGAIEGTVTEIEGLPIPGVTITASSPSLIGGSAVAFTDSGGHYHITALSPGTYDIKAELQGFQTVIRRGVLLHVGSTATVDFAIQAETVTESITVLGAPPLIDSATAATSNTVPPEIVQNLPQTHSMFGGILRLLPLTPGIGTDLVAYGGTGAVANRVWIDGVDISSPQAGVLFAQYNYNWIDEVQVAAIGAPAEYGGFTGAVASYVTRSGGNEFHGLFETFFQNQDLISSNSPNPEPEPSFKAYDFTAQVGGPIQHDKLWFFAGLHYPYNESHPFGYDGVTRQKYPKLFSKLTYKLNENNTLQGFGHYNYYYLDGVGAHALTLPEATSTDECNQASWNATWISILKGQTTFEGRFGGFWVDCEVRPKNGDIPGYFDGNTGVSSINALKHRAEQRFRPQLNAALSHFAEDFVGTHDFKFGVQVERATNSRQYGYNGDFGYFTYYYAYRYSDLGGDINLDNRIHQVSLYAQDHWNLTDKFALSLGVRWDHNRGITDRGTVFAMDPVAPRIGFVWKLRENRLTLLKAHYGDYYEALLAAQFDALSDTVFGFRGEMFNSEEQQWDLISQSRETYLIDPRAKHPFVRQFTVGIDQELPGGIALGAHYIYRRWKNILEDINTTSRYEPVPYINPITGEAITVFRRLDRFADQVLVLTNPAGLHREYNGFELIANRRFFNNLSISGSFVFSKITGNIPNDPEIFFTPFSDFLDNPNDSINFNGRLLNDPTIVWKIVGSYSFPWGFNAGWFFYHESGDTWTPRILVTGVEPRDFLVFGLPRGAHRLPSQNILDLRVEKRFPFAGGQFSVAADIFNVFNSAYIIEVDDRFGGARFGEALDFNSPRTISIGMRYTF